MSNGSKVTDAARGLSAEGKTTEKGMVVSPEQKKHLKPAEKDVKRCLGCNKEKHPGAKNGWARGLCPRCYARHVYKGTIEQFALTNGGTSKKRQPQYLMGPKLEHVSTECFKCGKKVEIELWPDAKVPKVLCYKCKDESRNNEKFMVSGSDLVRASNRLRKYEQMTRSVEVKIYRPGDDDFEAVAKTVTKITEIKHRDASIPRPFRWDD